MGNRKRLLFVNKALSVRSFVKIISFTLDTVITRKSVGIVGVFESQNKNDSRNINNFILLLKNKNTVFISFNSRKSISLLKPRGVSWVSDSKKVP